MSLWIAGKYMNAFLGQLRLRADTSSIDVNDSVGSEQPSLRCVHVDSQLSLRWLSSKLQSRQHICGPTKLLSQRWFMWEGRLDNREELERGVPAAERHDLADHELIALAFEDAGIALLPSLLGNWTLACVDTSKRQLLLARDAIGTQGLYYSSTAEAVLWSNSLDLLVRSLARSVAMCQEYIVGWLAGSVPLAVTPFVGIACVPPSTSVSIDQGGTRSAAFWTVPQEPWIAGNDLGYEERFRATLERAVTRCLQSCTPVIAELSGGMDSSSIVCMADRVSERQSLPRVHTLSYYAPAERGWETEDSVLSVETQRGSQGKHIPIRTEEVVDVVADSALLSMLPGRSARKLSASREVSDLLQTLQAEVLLSGWGGDELLGGIPDPIPILATLLRSGSLATWCRETFAWSLASRCPFAFLLARSAAAFVATRRRPDLTVGWLKQTDRVHARFAVFGSDPRHQDGLATLNALRAQLSSVAVDHNDRYEVRYPLLDRDLVEFAIRVPAAQWIRPGERRSLMRRTISGIVPEAVLQRRAKAAIVQGPLRRIAERRVDLQALVAKMHPETQHFIDPIELRQSLDRAGSGGTLSLPHLIRTFALDGWLRSIEAAGIWNGHVS